MKRKLQYEQLQQKIINENIPVEKLCMQQIKIVLMQKKRDNDKISITKMKRSELVPLRLVQQSQPDVEIEDMVGVVVISNNNTEVPQDHNQQMNIDCDPDVDRDDIILIQYRYQYRYCTTIVCGCYDFMRTIIIKIKQNEFQFIFFLDLTGARSENYEFGTSYILVCFVHAKIMCTILGQVTNIHNFVRTISQSMSTNLAF